MSCLREQGRGIPSSRPILLLSFIACVHVDITTNQPTNQKPHNHISKKTTLRSFTPSPNQTQYHPCDHRSTFPTPTTT